ncbi:uncharacterized protein L199_002384 [Kwoniella botswanensis]|uniref:uncharacterized protein n=1 Tax=Kwoniella botswanensis TaxID=1268659 RepID=UPI00315D7578
MFLFNSVACVLLGVTLIHAQSPVSLGCFTLPPNGPPPGTLLPTPAMNGVDCARQCDVPTPTHERWYGFFLPSSLISINCYCSATPPPNGDYTSCTSSDVYEAYQAESIFTFDGCFSSVCASNFQEFYVDSFDECIGNCFSNNWIVINIAPDNTIHCRCGGSYEIPPYNRQDMVDCNNEPNNWRVYRYFNIGPSGIARRGQGNRRSGSQNKRQELCPEGLTACQTSNGVGTGYECIDTNAEVDSCGGCVHGVYVQDQCHPTNGTTGTGQDCNALPGILPPAVDCIDGRCIAYKCDGSNGPFAPWLFPLIPRS